MTEQATHKVAWDTNKAKLIANATVNTRVDPSDRAQAFWKEPKDSVFSEEPEDEQLSPAAGMQSWKV